MNGKELPSVTTILKPLSIPLDIFNMPPDRAADFVRNVKNAADRGSRIHEATENYDLYGDLPDEEEDYDIYEYVLAYASFCADYKPVWIEIETAITDGRVAGTVDRIGIVEGIDGYIVPDIKSSATIHEISVSAQTWKYADIYSKHYRQGEYKLYVLQLKNDGTYVFKLLNPVLGGMAWEACENLNHVIRSIEK